VATPNKINSNNREKNRHRQDSGRRAGCFPTCDRPVENEVKASSITLSCRALDSKLNELLGKYTNLFIEVGGLPPKRAVEHEIQLISDSTLPNLRMYRNLVMENEEIKRQVTELLDTGVIKPSSSHCGSPIVLVPKKDGGWCMCIDYRALNKITIKN
jgi:formylmethanofuran dehydrogenase subunit B